MKNLFLITALVISLAVNAKPIMTNSTLDNLTIASVVTETDTFCTLIKQGNLEAVKDMIKAGADVNKKSIGMTPLMYAARQNRVEIVKLLIANGAELKVKSNKGFTALKYAEMSKAHETAQIISDELKDLKAKKKNKRSV
ncbi:MAG: ankyrin repeat domain-containing protein [Flavobacteriaceae bacterium]|nr:ankyrin repeat domain-containing protein [Flavobacteriaceae bacterium]